MTAPNGPLSVDAYRRPHLYFRSRLLRVENAVGLAGESCWTAVADFATWTGHGNRDERERCVRGARSPGGRAGNGCDKCDRGLPPAHWWQYSGCRMFSFTPWYIIVGEFGIALALALLAGTLRRGSWRTAVTAGVGAGLSIFVCYAVALFLTDRLVS